VSINSSQAAVSFDGVTLSDFDEKSRNTLSFTFKFAKASFSEPSESAVDGSSFVISSSYLIREPKKINKAELTSKIA
jgi:hypothetical protein